MSTLRPPAPASTMLRRLLAAGLAGLLCAAVSPQVETGLSDFRRGRFAEALANWQKAADAGDPRGALYVGVMYDSGVGVPRNFRAAMTWYRRAAADGSAAAAFNVGVLYDGGFGVDPDQREAAAWYEKAAAAGFGRAQYNLALLYDTGAGVPVDHARAVALFRSAAANGIAAANAHLAAMHESVGRKVPQKPHDPAPDEFQQAEQALLQRGPANAGRAAKLFRQAADGHNAVAEYDLGYCYEHGIGVTTDLAEAQRWYRRAADDAPDDPLRSMAQAGASHAAAPQAEPK